MPPYCGMFPYCPFYPPCVVSNRAAKLPWFVLIGPQLDHWGLTTTGLVGKNTNTNKDIYLVMGCGDGILLFIWVVR